MRQRRAHLASLVDTSTCTRRGFDARSHVFRSMFTFRTGSGHALQAPQKAEGVH